MGCLCAFFYLGVFLIGPIGVAAKAAADEHRLHLRLFFGYLAVYFAGVFIAAGVTLILAFALPKPSGSPDQAVGQSMVLVFALFPILSLILGATGLAVMMWRIDRSAARSRRSERPHHEQVS